MSCEYSDEICYQNSVRTVPGLYSCAVDSFLELYNEVFYSILKSVTPLSQFFEMMNNFSCDYRRIKKLFSEGISRSRLEQRY